MRQSFNVGDLVRIDWPIESAGIVVATAPRTSAARAAGSLEGLHPDEYSCKIRSLDPDEREFWVRANFLEHISKISE